MNFVLRHLFDSDDVLQLWATAGLPSANFWVYLPLSLKNR
jgi:hypothetical protein